MALLFAFVLLAAACGDDSGNEDASDASTASEPTDTTEGDDTGDEPPASDLTVGLAYDLGGRGDQSFNDSAAAGLDRAVEELGIEAPTELEPDEGGENRQELLQTLCDDQTQLIFAVGFLYSESVGAVAENCPTSTFAVIDDATNDLPNVANLTFAEEEGSFLVGAAAALTTESNHVGFVGGVNIELIQKFQAGFEAGVAAVDPSITVDVEYLTEPPDFDGFNDPARGREVAATMYEGGADVVYHAAGGSGAGVFEAALAARDAGGTAWAIGVDSDQYNTADPSVQDVILTSMLKRVDVAVFNTIEAAVGGEAPTSTTFDLSVDGVGYSTSGDFMPQEVIDQLEDFKQQIIDGEIEVPTVPGG
ncbi:MAG TPA: BMP family ABC transporter substrate-binding protein [Acidimicrobiales bacterium]|nr:BMP family ABC transporter substrate-binding protein [Acidimicrobiales bacterium]